MERVLLDPLGEVPSPVPQLPLGAVLPALQGKVHVEGSAAAIWPIGSESDSEGEYEG